METLEATAAVGFEREVQFLLQPLSEKGKKADIKQLQRLSSRLFSLLNKHEKKLSAGYFHGQLVAIGDRLLQAKAYSLAGIHGYTRYLKAVGITTDDPVQSLSTYFSQHDSLTDISLTIRSVIGSGVCAFTIKELEDGTILLPSSCSLALSVLHSLQLCAQASLTNETLYWLLYNTATVTYSISQKLMSIGMAGKVLESLLWCSTCIESCVPLMAVKYLPLRVCLYTAVCQCYYTIRQPLQAELFARRCLDKVHQLAQIEHQSSSSISSFSSLRFSEATIKLGVMVFKRSVLESRKKTKSILRPKVRPTVKDHLQTPWPRSPTEKLLEEMFTGVSAQFLAVLETLSDHKGHALTRCPPRPVSDLDEDTVTDVFEELLCAGSDLVLNALDQSEGLDCSTPLMQLAMQGNDIIPLETMIEFTRTAYTLDNTEVFMMLAPKIIEVATAASSNGDQYGQAAGVVSLRIIETADSLQQAIKKTNVLAEDREVWKKAVSLLNLLYHWITSCPSSAIDKDLLLDASLFVWDVSSDVFTGVVSHDQSTSKQMLDNPEYLVFLERLVAVFRAANLPIADAVLHCTVTLKYGLLLEARSEQLRKRDDILPSQSRFLLYDRAKLLESQSLLQESINDICLSREKWRARQLEDQREKGESMLAILHTELLFALTRVNVKLASTIPPSCPKDDTGKLSSLETKVQRRNLIKQQWEKTISQLTASDVSVCSEAELQQQCSHNSYLKSLLLMVIASTSPSASDNSTYKQSLLQEAFHHLKLISQNQKQSNSVTSSSSLLPPILIHQSPTTLLFSAPRFTPPQDSQPVAYYSIYGRSASGSNVQVRLNDKEFEGTGIPVEVSHDGGCVFEINGLAPDQEYVFAVAAYNAQGQVIGGSIGPTSAPVLTAYSLPVSTALGYLCQCSYQARVLSVTRSVAELLWDQYVLPLTDDDDEQLLPLYRLKQFPPTSPAPVLLHFISSVFMHIHTLTQDSNLSTSSLGLGAPLRSNHCQRLKLASRLLVVMELAGWLDNTSLCLQAVVMCYSLLVPLLQLQIVSTALLELLLRCHAVLQELPDDCFNSLQPPTTNSVHHMIAAISFAITKLSVQLNQRSLLSLIADSSRKLLLATLPPITPTFSSLLHSASVKEDQILQQNSLSSTPATGDPSTPGTPTPSSLPSFQPLGGRKIMSGSRQKRRKKKTAAGDHVSDESKTIQYKAFESFLFANQALQTDEPALTGQEDPMFLHGVINTLPIQTAYKEVHKFKRRPQYLEYYVHLATAAVAQGRLDLVVGWSREVFAWLKRRNDLILTPKGPPQTQRPPEGPTISRQGRVPGGKKTAEKKSSRIGSAENTNKESTAVATSGKLEDSVKTGQTQTAGTTTTIARQIKRPPSVRRAEKTLLALRHKITRDDLSLKAVSVLQHLLPRLWRASRCRHRLRTVCVDEQPWRAEANKLTASCFLDRLLSLVTTPSCLLPVSMEWSQFAVAGSIGSIPSYDSENTKLMHLTSVPLDETCTTRDFSGAEREADNPLGALQKMLLHLQRAAVLAHRGKCWILLYNASRVLWNALMTLHSHLPPTPQPPSSNASSSSSPLILTVSLLYWMACKTLHMTADLLLDAYEHLHILPSSSTFPSSSSLQTSSGGDQTTLFTPTFAKELVFLAVEAANANRHWEKVVQLATRFNTLTNGSWQDQLSPIISSAKEKLVIRMKKFAKANEKERFPPAAHLDLRGHDVYGPVGYSLGLTALSLSEIEVKHAPAPTCSQGEKELLQARRLFCQYLSKNGAVTAGDSLPTPSLSEVTAVVDAYCQAVGSLEKEKRKGLRVQGLHELGNLTCHTRNIRSAHRWWLQGLQVLLHSQDPLNQWRKLLAHSPSAAPLEVYGVWGCLLGGILASKLAFYVHRAELDIRMEYCHMSASFFKALFNGSLPHPMDDIDYSSYRITSLLPGVDILSDPFRCSSTILLSSLHLTSQELVKRGHFLSSLPLLTLYEYISHHLCRSIQHTVLSQTYRLKCLSHLQLFSEAVKILKDLLTGANLPQLTCQFSRQNESYLGSLANFADHLPLDDPHNVKIVTILVNKQSLSSSLREAYGDGASSEVLLAQAELFVLLASTSPVVSVNTLSRTMSTGRSITSLSTTSSRPLLTTEASIDGSPTLVRRNTKGTLGSSTQDIKLMLLEAAEKLIYQIAQEDESEEQDGYSDASFVEEVVRCLLLMGEVTAVLQRSQSTAQLALAALRRIQQASVSSCDMFLWLQCRQLLAQALVSSPSSDLSCVSVCEEGVLESRSCGDPELAASFLYTVACHLFLRRPCPLTEVRSHTQQALQQLESVAQLSQQGQLLQAQLSLLLAESMAREGPVTKELATAFGGVYHLLQQQIKSQSSGASQSFPSNPTLLAELNCFKPQLPLQALASLMEAHSNLILAKQARETQEAISYYHEVNLSIEKGLCALERHVHSDKVVHSEFLLMSALVEFKIVKSTPLSDNAPPPSLLKTLQIISSVKLDHKLAFLCYCKLAEFFAAHYKPEQEKEKKPKEDRRYSLQPSPKSSRQASRLGTKQLSSASSTKDVRPEQSKRKEDLIAYHGWCSVKSASACLLALDNLTRSSVELHNDELSKLIPDKIFKFLPDSVLLSLCNSDELLKSLVSGDELSPSIDLLLPSAQFVSPSGLTWFTLTSHFNKQLQQCLYINPSSSSTQWFLHAHSLTPTLSPLLMSLQEFLTARCPSFSSKCSLPAIPPLLAQTKSSKTDIATSSQAELSHIAAGGLEVCVEWYTDHSDTAPVHMLIAINNKPMRVQAPVQSSGLDVYVAKNTLDAFTQLYRMWSELAEACNDYLAQPATRPLSRSHSPRMRRKSMEQAKLPFPSEQEEKMNDAIAMMISVFGVQCTDPSKFPNLDPQSVLLIVPALHPFSPTVVKGGACLFLSQLLGLRH